MDTVTVYSFFLWPDLDQIFKPEVLLTQGFTRVQGGKRRIAGATLKFFEKLGCKRVKEQLCNA